MGTDYTKERADAIMDAAEAYADAKKGMATLIYLDGVTVLSNPRAVEAVKAHVDAHMALARLVYLQPEATDPPLVKLGQGDFTTEYHGRIGSRGGPES